MRSESAAWLGVLGICLMAFTGGLILGLEIRGDVMRQGAIDNNAAHWTIDAKTGEREFIWGPAND